MPRETRPSEREAAQNRPSPSGGLSCGCTPGATTCRALPLAARLWMLVLGARNACTGDRPRCGPVPICGAGAFGTTALGAASVPRSRRTSLAEGISGDAWQPTHRAILRAATALGTATAHDVPGSVGSLVTLNVVLILATASALQVLLTFRIQLGPPLVMQIESAKKRRSPSLVANSCLPALPCGRISRSRCCRLPTRPTKMPSPRRAPHLPLKMTVQLVMTGDAVARCGGTTSNDRICCDTAAYRYRSRHRSARIIGAARFFPSAMRPIAAEPGQQGWMTAVGAHPGS
jgi:hypothetical protein